MVLLMILPGIIFILLMGFFLKLKISQKLMSPTTPQPEQSAPNSEMSLVPRLTGVEEEGRKTGIVFVCKRKGITFKPKFENKQPATKIVYLAHVEESNAVVFFKNLYKTFEKDNGRVSTPRCLFELHLPGKEGTCNGNGIINPPLHCRGLFVLPTGINTILVCNPATKEVLALPESTNRHIARSSLDENVGANKRVGFGFASSTQAYKVTQFFYRSIDLGTGSYSMGFEVFTIGVSSSWRVLDNDPPYPLATCCTTLTGNRICFRISPLFGEAPKAFLFFNLSSEKFSTIFPPKNVDGLDINHMFLSTLQRRICLSTTICFAHFVVYSYKGGTKWERMFHILTPNARTFSTQMLIADFEPVAEHQGSLLTRVHPFSDETLQFNQSPNLMLYNSKDRSFEEVNDPSVDKKMKDGGCRVFDGKPWFAVSSYEPSPYRLCASSV